MGRVTKRTDRRPHGPYTAEVALVIVIVGLVAAIILGA
jgi:hypothetical protein